MTKSQIINPKCRCRIEHPVQANALPGQYLNLNGTNSKQFRKFEFKYLNLFRISDFGFRICQRGFTIVEVLVGTVVVIALGIGIMGLQSIITHNRLLVWRSYLSVNDANSSMQTLVKELRMARSGDNGAYALEVVGDQEIVFYSDIDFDEDTEKVTYSLIDSTLYKKIIEPEGFPIGYSQEQEKSRILTENVRNGTAPVFYYYNGDWPVDTENNPLPEADRLSNTKSIGIYLRLNTEAGVSDKDYILESSVQMRMLKENL